MHNTHRTYRGLIEEVDVKQIFVFGSNPEGRHGKGAALFAIRKAGAIYGQARGLQGRSYGIVTVDIRNRRRPNIRAGNIVLEIEEMYRFAMSRPDSEFLVAYSGTEPNLNGYTNQEMADMFFVAGDIPPNLVFEETFYGLIRRRMEEEIAGA